MARKKKIGKELQKLRKTLQKEMEGFFRDNPGKTLNYKQVAAALNIGAEDEFSRLLVRENLEYLKTKGALEEPEIGSYRCTLPKGKAEGKVDMMSNGNAYVLVEGFEEDVFIPEKFVNRALHGDRVQIQLHARRKGKNQTGEVLEVLERVNTQFVGLIEIQNNTAFCIPDSDKMPVDIYISQNDLNGAAHGMKAVVELTEWPERRKNPQGKVVQVLGMKGENETEMHAILAEYGFPSHFPDEVEAYAESISFDLNTEEIKRRRDMRGVPTLTIDPADAKDFDDALSLQRLENGNWEVGIHIADVSYYVPENSMLDKEAYKRATSVYLVDRVVPMLPEKLSNGVCSLRPNEEKFCFSAIFEMNEASEVISEWFGRTVIYSDKRFAYEDAQEVIENGKGEMAEEILTLHRLAGNLRQKRFNDGALRIEQTEVKFHLDEKGKPTGVYFKVSKEANHLIEEFMLLANRKVAAFIGEKRKKQTAVKTFVYRIHDSPDLEKLKEFKKFVAGFGYKLDLTNRKAISNSINKVLEEVKGKPEQNMIETLSIRSMQKAVYSTSNIGHYGLAFDFYTHFTSPIRRYPDVLVHRLLQRYLDEGSSVAADGLEKQCKHSSEMEKKAAEAERASVKYKQVEYLRDRVGDTFEGVISGVTEWGIYVEIKENKCEGMIRLREMGNEYFTFDERNYCVRGSRSGRVYRLGDTVKILVKRADLEKRQLDFKLADDEGVS